VGAVGVIPIGNVKLVIYDNSTTETEYGDELAAGIQVAEVTGVVIEKTMAKLDPTMEHPVILHYQHVTLPAGTPAKRGYRLRDIDSGTVYQIDYVKNTHAFMGYADLELECHIV
jgi:hypothetical protein